MRLVDRAPVRSDFLTGLLRERERERPPGQGSFLAGPVFTGPNLLAHVPLQRGLLPKEPSVHVSVAVYLGPGGPAVTGKDWAKSLSLSLSLSLSICHGVSWSSSVACLCGFFFVVSQDIFSTMSLHTIVPLTFLWWLELLWCSRFCRSATCCVGAHALVQRFFRRP